MDHEAEKMSTALPPKGQLLIEFPDLVTQWHRTKNGAVTPDKVVAGSGKKYWWKCPEGSDHEWEATVNNRAGWRIFTYTFWMKRGYRYGPVGVGLRERGGHQQANALDLDGTSSNPLR